MNYLNYKLCTLKDGTKEWLCPECQRIKKQLIASKRSFYPQEDFDCDLCREIPDDVFTVSIPSSVRHKQ